MRSHGFTLVELMVAAAIGFIIVGAGADIASSMVRATRTYEEQAEIGARTATTAAYIKATLNSTAYNWTVPAVLSSTTSTGSFGPGHCATSTTVCPADRIMRALELCSSPTVTQTTCPAPTSTTADAIKTIVPRDGTIEAVIIQDRTATPLPANCTLGTGPITFDVKGTTRAAWQTNDLVMVTTGGHVNVGRVASTFSAQADATITRTLTLDLGDSADFALDDGGSTVACDASRSLKRAVVIRVKQVIIKHINATKELAYGEQASSATPMVFATLVPEVEDFGARFDIARFPGGSSPTGVPALCTADTSAIFNGGTTLTGACAGQRLNADRVVAAVNRVIGVRLGVVLRSRIETQSAATSVVGVFDRTGIVATDNRLHRKSFFYVGLPNANAF